MNEAAVTVPAVDGNVTPPVAERVPAGVNTTVPAVDDCTATFPKFMSTSLVMLIGVTIVAVAVAVAVSCACAAVARHASAHDARRKSDVLFMLFILDLRIKQLLSARGDRLR